jgi:copper resistance protein D
MHMPVFAPDGGPALVLARGLAVAFLLSVSGTLTFRAVVLPRALARLSPEETRPVERALLRWCQASLLAAALGLCAWLAVLTAHLANPDTLGDWAADLGPVLTETSFGRVALLQFLLLIAAGIVLGRTTDAAHWRIALIFGTAAAVLEVGHGHAYAMASGVSFLELSVVLHLWAAGAWLGGLVPLLLVVQLAAPVVAATAARRFSPLGKLCVVLLAASASLQGWVLVGSKQALFHTAYGWTALLKLSLFAVLIGIAIVNRYWLAPDLVRKDPSLARRRLVASLSLETSFGLLIVLAAALLGQLRPGMSMGMPG